MPEPTPHYLPGVQPAEEAEGLASRWTRRKRAVAREAAEAETATTSADHAKATQVVVEPKALPPIETLTGESDFTGFLSPEVDETLRKAALRKLFHLPDFNITDGLNDYDGDYTVFEPLGNVVPYYLKQWIAREAAEAEAALQQAIAETNPAAEDEVVVGEGPAAKEPQTP